MKINEQEVGQEGIAIELHYSKSPGLFFLDVGTGKRSAYFSKDQAQRILKTVDARTREGGSFEELLAGLEVGDREFGTLFIDPKDKGLILSLMSGQIIGAEPKVPSPEEQPLESVSLRKFNKLICEANGDEDDWESLGGLVEADGIDYGREPLATKLVDQLRSLGVEFPESATEEYQRMISHLTRLLSLLASPQAAVIHKGGMAPLMIVLTKLAYFPVDPKELNTAIASSPAFANMRGMKGFPYSAINYFISSGILSREEKRADSRVMPGNAHVRDLVDYLKFIKLNTNKVIIPK